jgi:enoyl-CoA hydratase/carnithine racemase
MSVSFTVEQTFAVIRLDSGAGNLVTGDLETLFADALGDLDQQPGLSALLLVAAGPDFSIGRDPSSLVFENPPDRNAALERRLNLARRLLSLPIPSVAVLQGRAAGPALSWAMLCDLRVAHEGARISVPECADGYLPEYGLLARLTQLAGTGVATDLVLTGRTITASEALAHGLVSRVIPGDRDLESEAKEFARPLQSSPPFSIKMARSIVANLSQQAVEQSLRIEFAAQALALESADFAELMAARREQRPPAFSGR